MVDVDSGRSNPLAACGDSMRSGNGRELRECGVEESLEVLSLQL